MPRSLEEIVLAPGFPKELADKLLGIANSGRPLVYLAGPMRLHLISDVLWRERVGPELERMGYGVFNTIVIEAALHGKDYFEFQRLQSELITRRHYRSFHKIFGPVLELDLALIHELKKHPKSALVVYYPTDIIKSGTDIECFEAYRAGVATFVKLEGPRIRVRPFINDPWIELYAAKKFKAFHSWKSLLAHLEKWLVD